MDNLTSLIEPLLQRLLTILATVNAVTGYKLRRLVDEYRAEQDEHALERLGQRIDEMLETLEQDVRHVNLQAHPHCDSVIEELREAVRACLGALKTLDTPVTPRERILRALGNGLYALGSAQHFGSQDPDAQLRTTVKQDTQAIRAIMRTEGNALGLEPALLEQLIRKS